MNTHMNLSGGMPPVRAQKKHIALFVIACILLVGTVFCTLAFITGFLYRLSMLPMIFTMIMAVFVVHANDPFSAKELALLYLYIFLIMYCLGPGSFAADYFFARRG